MKPKTQLLLSVGALIALGSSLAHACTDAFDDGLHQIQMDHVCNTERSFAELKTVLAQRIDQLCTDGQYAHISGNDLVDAAEKVRNNNPVIDNETHVRQKVTEQFVTILSSGVSALTMQGTGDCAMGPQGAENILICAEHDMKLSNDRLIKVGYYSQRVEKNIIACPD